MVFRNENAARRVPFWLRRVAVSLRRWRKPHEGSGRTEPVKLAPIADIVARTGREPPPSL